jgi:hypothetical protein
MASPRGFKLVQSWLFATAPNTTTHFHSNYYVISLYHDSVSGNRCAKLNFEEIPGSFGASSMMMQGSHRIDFVIEDRPGYIEIKRANLTSFVYKCVVDNGLVPEAHRRYRGSERKLFSATINIVENAPSDDVSGTLVTWYSIEARRHDDTVAISHRSGHLKLFYFRSHV